MLPAQLLPLCTTHDTHNLCDTMVRFNPVSKGEPLPSASGGGDPGGRPGYSDKPPLAQRKDKASSRTRNPRRFKKAGSSRYSYDAASRYDPNSMTRIEIVQNDNDLDLDEIIDPTLGDDDPMAALGVDFSLDGLYQAQKRRPRYQPSASCRRCLNLAFLFTCGMAILIGITHLAVGRNGGKLTKHGMVLPSPPKDLMDVCSLSAIRKGGGYRRCEGHCVEAECCFLPEGHWFSCKKSHALQCATYEKACVILDEYGDGGTKGNNGAGAGSGGAALVVKVPDAPNNLDKVCSPEKLSSPEGFNSCKAVCLFSDCCNQPDTECIVSNPSACKAYEPCVEVQVTGNGNGGSMSIGAGAATLGLTPKSHPEAASSKAQFLCNTSALLDAKGVTGCKNFCDPALCCFAPEGENIGVHMMNLLPSTSTSALTETLVGCANNDNADWCHQYNSCSAIFTVDSRGYGTDEKAKQAVTDACKDLDFDNTAQMDQCNDVCTPGACCYVDSDDHCDSIGLDGIDCDHYEACFPLYDMLSGDSEQEVLIPRPPDDLAKTCSKPNIKTEKGKQACADMCSVAHCCVTEIEVCRVVNPNMCEAYEIHCAKIWDTPFKEVEVPMAPCDLEDTCGGASVDDSQFGLCEDACRPARCCDEDISVCKVTNPYDCEPYRIHCGTVWGDSHYVKTIPDAPMSIFRDCAGVELSEDNWDRCVDTCKPAECCDEDIEVCRVSNPDACEPYEVHCAEVWGDAYQEVTVPNAPADLTTFCAAGYVSDTDSDRHKCNDLCYMAKCCSEDIESCKVLNPNACEAYMEPCAYFWGNSVTVPAPPSNLWRTCSEESLNKADGYAKCEELCQEAWCCDQPMESCRVTNPEVCEDYSVCSNLSAGVDNSKLKNGKVEVPKAAKDMATMCAPTSLSDVHGFNDCEARCTRARCCLEDDEECEVSNPEVCADYIDPCTNLYNFRFGLTWTGGEGIDAVHMMDLASQVDESCTAKSLLEIQGRQHCQHLCNDRLCCFADDETNCVEDRASECVAFAACNVLLTMAGTDYMPAPTPAATRPTAPARAIPSPTSNNVDIMEDNTTAEEIDLICSSNKLKSPTGLQICHEVCDEKFCCFDKKNSVNCYADDPDMCDAYEGCLDLYDYEGIEYVVQLERDISDLCAPSKLETSSGKIMCREVCEPHSSCFSSPTNPPTRECRNYSACGNLTEYTGGSTGSGSGSESGDCGFIEVDLPDNEVTEACCPGSANDSKKDLCELQCKNTARCFNGSNRSEVLETFCEEYAACQVLFL